MVGVGLAVALNVEDDVVVGGHVAVGEDVEEGLGVKVMVVGALVGAGRRRWQRLGG